MFFISLPGTGSHIYIKFVDFILFLLILSSSDSFMSLGRYLSKDFVVCFVADAKTKLELYPLPA